MVLFVSICLALTVILVWVGYQYGPHIALATSSAIVLLMPRWISFDAMGHDVDLWLVNGIVALGYYCLHPKSTFKAKLIALDYVMLIFVVIVCTSDIINSGIKSENFIQLYAEWFVPYVLGRLSLAYFRELRTIVLPFAVVVFILSSLAIAESVSGTNPLELLINDPSTNDEYYAERWGFKRALGPTENPIYFGVLMYLLQPWLLQFSISKWEETRQYSWLFLSAIGIAGVLASVSRAPIFALCTLVVVPIFIYLPRFRIPITAATVVLPCIAFFFQQTIIDSLETIGEDRHKQVVLLDGKERVATSTTIRLQLWNFYETAVQQAGLFGYGTYRTSMFPPQVPMGGNNDVTALKALFAIDNEFLLIILRFGYLGVTCWAIGLALSVYNFGRLALVCPIDLKWFCAFCSSVLAGIFFIQCTVWMPQDYGFHLIWLMGASSGLYAHHLIKSRMIVSRN